MLIASNFHGWPKRSTKIRCRWVREQKFSIIYHHTFGCLSCPNVFSAQFRFLPDEGSHGSIHLSYQLTEMPHHTIHFMLMYILYKRSQQQHSFYTPFHQPDCSLLSILLRFFGWQTVIWKVCCWIWCFLMHTCSISL